MVRYCTNCGKKVPDEARYCEYCGMKLNTTTTQSRISNEPKSYYNASYPVFISKKEKKASQHRRSASHRKNKRKSRLTAPPQNTQDSQNAQHVTQNDPTFLFADVMIVIGLCFLVLALMLMLSLF